MSIITMSYPGTRAVLQDPSWSPRFQAGLAPKAQRDHSGAYTAFEFIRGSGTQVQRMLVGMHPRVLKQGEHAQTVLFFLLRTHAEVMLQPVTCEL
jgi:hypothetical protein